MWWGKQIQFQNLCAVSIQNVSMLIYIFKKGVVRMQLNDTNYANMCEGSLTSVRLLFTKKINAASPA